MAEAREEAPWLVEIHIVYSRVVEWWSGTGHRKPRGVNETTLRTTGRTTTKVRTVVTIDLLRTDTAVLQLYRRRGGYVKRHDTKLTIELGGD